MKNFVFQIKSTIAFSLILFASLNMVCANSVNNLSLESFTDTGISKNVEDAAACMVVGILEDFEGESGSTFSQGGFDFSASGFTVSFVGGFTNYIEASGTGNVGSVSIATAGSAFVLNNMDVYVSLSALGATFNSGDITVTGTALDGSMVSATVPVVGPPGSTYINVSFAGTPLENLPLTNISITLGTDLQYIAIDNMDMTILGTDDTYVYINNASIIETDAGTFLVFDITRTDNSQTFSLTANTSDNTAIAGTDYTAVSTTVNFTAGGSLTETVSVPIIGDSMIEADEFFSLLVSGFSASICELNGMATGTILDDDTLINCEDFQEDGPAGETSFTFDNTTFDLTGDLVVSFFGPDFYVESNLADEPHSGNVGSIILGCSGFFFVHQLDLWTSTDGNPNLQNPGAVQFIGNLSGGGTVTTTLTTSSAGGVFTQGLSFEGTPLDGVALTSLEIVLVDLVHYFAIDNFKFSSEQNASLESNTPTCNGGTNGSILFSKLTPSTNYMISYLVDGTPVGPIAITSDASGFFDLMNLAAGAYTDIIISTIGGTPCMSNTLTTIIMNEAGPVAAFVALADLCLDAGVQAGLSGGTPTGGEYSGPGVTDDENGMTYSFDPATAGVGVHTITYTVGAVGCSDSAMDDVEVFALPAVTFSALADLCLDGGVQAGQGSGTPTGGVYSGVGVTDDGNGMTYSFDPAAAGSGTHTITYTVGVSGCTDSAMDDVEVFSTPTASFTTLADLCVDAGVQAGQGGGSPTGGVYSGAGVTDDGNGMTYSFDPAAAGVGTHTITYTVGTAGCTDSAMDDVEVFAVPTVTFTALADLCLDAGVQAGQGGGTPTGGVYSGAGVTDDGNGMTYSFDPAAAGIGVHTISYDYTDSNGCMDSASDDVEVFSVPTVGLSTALYYCEDATIQSITLSGGSPAGGVYSGVGVTDNGLGTGYFLDPTVNGPGILTVTYTLTDVNGCSNSDNSDIEILDCTIAISQPCGCLNNATVIDLNAGTGGDDGQFIGAITISGVGTMLPGIQTWTVTAASGAFDADNLPAVGVQSPGVAIATDGSVTLVYNPGSGTYTLPFVHVDNTAYSISIEGPFGMGSPANVTLTISNICQYPNPVFDPSLSMLYCDSESAITLAGTDQNGVGADGVTFTIDGAASTSFDPGSLSLGDHTVVMTFDGADDGNMGVSPDGGTTPASPGCIQTVQIEIEIVEMPDASFTALADLCLDAGVQAGLGGGTPTGGVYSGAGVTDDGNGMTYGFDPSTAGVGTHTISYTVGSSECSDVAMDDVEVFALPTVMFTALTDLCIDAGVQAGLGGGTPTDGVYSGSGVTDDGNGMTYSFDPSTAGVGTHTITYDFTGGNGCMNSVSDDIEVFALPIAVFTAPSDLCLDAGVQTGLDGGTPTGGVYSGSGVTDDGNGMTYSFDPSAAGIGMQTITYSLTDANGCSDDASDQVQINDCLMMMDISINDPCSCDNPENVTLDDGSFLFQDTIIVTSMVGPVTLMDPDNLLDDLGNPLAAGTSFTLIGPNTYQLIVYTLEGETSTAIISNGVSTIEQLVGGCVPCPLLVPTLSEWGLLILLLLIISFGLISMYNLDNSKRIFSSREVTNS